MTTEPRRQARGLARIEAILDATAELIAEGGAESLGMNEVARRADISPGSLYQYFSDKRSLLAALTERFAEGLAATFPPEPDAEIVRTAPLPDLLDAIMDPVLGFLLGNAGFRTLFVQNEGPADLAAILEPVHIAIIGRLEAVIAARAPHLTRDDAQRVALMCELIVKGALPAIADAAPDESKRLVNELRVVLLRYLGPLEGLEATS